MAMAEALQSWQWQVGGLVAAWVSEQQPPAALETHDWTSVVEDWMADVGWHAGVARQGAERGMMTMLQLMAVVAAWAVV